MCIEKSVGKKGKNLRGDVLVVQAGLNITLPVYDRFIPRKQGLPLVEDGAFGANTSDRIAVFQRHVVGLRVPDRTVDPEEPERNRAKTIKALKSIMPSGFNWETKSRLRGIMEGPPGPNINKWGQFLFAKMELYQINTPLRRAHFLAQLYQESDGFRTAEEYADGSDYENRPDLGNTEPGDGKRFKGRGLIQLTGRKNYQAYGEYLGIKDFENKKSERQSLVANPARAVDVSCWYFATHAQLNPLADADDLKGITRLVNGAVYEGAPTHLKRRRRALAKAKFFLPVNQTGWSNPWTS